MKRMIKCFCLFIAAFGLIGVSFTSASFASTPHPQVTCGTEEYYQSAADTSQYINGGTSPDYYVLTSTNATDFCEETDSSGYLVLEQYGTSRCLDYDATGAEEAHMSSCSAAAAEIDEVTYNASQAEIELEWVAYSYCVSYAGVTDTYVYAGTCGSSNAPDDVWTQYAS